MFQRPPQTPLLCSCDQHVSGVPTYPPVQIPPLLTACFEASPPFPSGPATFPTQGSSNIKGKQAACLPVQRLQLRRDIADLLLLLPIDLPRILPSFSHP